MSLNRAKFYIMLFCLVYLTIYKFALILKLKGMGDIGFSEILLILLVVVLLFGGRKIPELMKGLGQGIKEFKKASQYNPEEEKKRDPEATNKE
jgi:sec-independent protein translocase protein TatA